MNARKSLQKRGSGRWIRVLSLLVLVLVVGTWAAGAAAKFNLLNHYPAPGQLVNVGGYKMHLYCTGQGSPTVILAAGLDDFSTIWSLVQPEAAHATRVCSYDRAGMGWSEPSPSPRKSENMVRELHALLVNAGVEGPYVLVGHSFGGALVRMYAREYPAEVTGMVLVDSVHEDLFLRVPAWRKAIEAKLSLFRSLTPLSSFGLLALAPEQIPNRGLPEDALDQYRAVSAATHYYQTGIMENQTFEKNLAEARAAQVSSLGDLPLVVLSRGYWDPIPFLTEDENRQGWQVWQETQIELVSLSTHSRQIIAEGSEHHIQLQQPQLVIDAIAEVVEAAGKDS